jgi:hypothetical protein
MGGQKWRILYGLACVKDRNIVVTAMRDAPTLLRNRTEVLRRKWLRKYWADPVHREAQRMRQNRIWADPKRRKDQGERMKRYMANPKHRKAQSKLMKRVMRSPERREAQSKIMKRLHADPTFQAHRIAAFRKFMANPEEKALRAATFRKVLAVPAVHRRRIKGMKKFSSAPENRAAMSAFRKKWWDDIRARLAALTGTAKIPNRGRGRPRMDELYGNAAILHAQGMSYREIARQKDANFANDPDAAAERMRIGIRRIRQTKKLRDSRP